MHARLRILLCLALAAPTGVVAGKVTLIPVVTVPGSVSTAVFGINDDNVIVGSYVTSDGHEHGYFGTFDGNYTTFDVGNNGTEPRSIGNDGVIIGFSNSSQIGHEHSLQAFERLANGTIEPIKKRGAQVFGIIQGINNPRDEFVGDYAISDGDIEGYYGIKGKYKASLTLPFDTTQTHPRGINGANAVVGAYNVTAQTSSGFLLQDGNVSTVNFPDPSAVSTFLEGINDKGLATGIWEDEDSDISAFTWNTTSNAFTPIKVPNATLVEAFGVNKAGLVAVDSDVGPFIYCPKAKSKCPSNGQEAIEEPALQVRTLCGNRNDDARVTGRRHADGRGPLTACSVTMNATMATTR
jgi:hypothetical protein